MREKQRRGREVGTLDNKGAWASKQEVNERVERKIKGTNGWDVQAVAW